jgi:hypothetical protein
MKRFFRVLNTVILPTSVQDRLDKLNSVLIDMAKMGKIGNLLIAISIIGVIMMSLYIIMDLEWLIHVGFSLLLVSGLIIILVISWRIFQRLFRFMKRGPGENNDSII